MKGMHFSRWAAAAGLIIGLLASIPVMAQDAYIGFRPDVEGQVHAVALQPDGRILIGGVFTAVSGIPRTNLARLNTDGTPDPGFNPGAVGVNSYVNALAVRPDGTILVGGNFTALGGQLRSNLGQLLYDGTADSRFTSTADDNVNCLALQADGKILVGGSFHTLDGESRLKIGRLNADGTLDTSFNPEINPGVPRVHSLAVQADGKILVGGGFSLMNGQGRRCLGRLNSDGSLDTDFNPDVWTTFDPAVLALEVQVDGRILVGGRFSTVGGEARTNLARLNPDGSLDTTFNARADGGDVPGVYTLALQPDGKVLVGGSFSTLNGVPHGLFGRLNVDGTLDTTLDPEGAQAGTIPTVRSLVVQPNGYILVAGDFAQLHSSSQYGIGRVSPYGENDYGLNWWVNGPVNCLAVAANGMIWIGGQFTQAGVEEDQLDRRNLMGFNPLKPAMAPDTVFANREVSCFALQADGKILVGGGFDQLNGEPRNRIGRISPDGVLDTSFNPGVASDSFAGVRTLAVQRDGRILVGGEFTTLAGGSRTNLGRLNPNGTLDTSFNPGVVGIVDCLAVQPDGKILVGGGITHLAGQTRIRIGRLNPDGTLDAAFDPGANNSPSALLVQPDGKILVGGLFTILAGSPRSYLGRLHPDGTLDTNFNPVADNRAYSLALQTDGKILAGGRFTTLAGQPRNRIARLHPNGTLDAGFDPDLGESAFAEVRSILPRENGNLIVGGSFATVGGQPHPNFFRLPAVAAPRQSLTLDATGSVVWRRSGPAPEFKRVAFEGSFGGTTYLSMGEGVYIDGAWRKERARLGQAFPSYIRARGWPVGDSHAMVESVRQFFVPVTAPVLTATMPPGSSSFHLSFPYPSGITPSVLATSDLTQPLFNWTTLGQAVEFAPRQYRFIDAPRRSALQGLQRPAPKPVLRRFYQVGAP